MGPTRPDGVGLWAGFLDAMPASDALEAVRRLEGAGVGTIWLQEYSGVDPFVRAALYFGATDDLKVGLGVATIHGRDSEAMVAVAATLEEAFPGRFVLGLGVSHSHLVAARGLPLPDAPTGLPPLARMRAYLADMDGCRGTRRLPLRVLGALGPRMVELAGSATDGVHTYFMPVEHTAQVRASVGPDAWVAPTQLVAVDASGPAWRDSVRRYLGLCLAMPNYRGRLLALGFTEDDLDTASDAVVDALVVPDEPDAVSERLEAHRRAGADHVVVQLVPPPQPAVVLERVARGLRWGT